MAKRKIRDEKDVREAVGKSAADGERLEIVGGGTKSGFGRPVEPDRILNVGGVSGISLYEPAALTLVAKPGTKLDEIEKALAGEGQHLPFEPPHLNSLYSSSGHATIGGTIACGLSGPRRIQVGAARDSLIGVRFVTGTGEVVKNGGRVMKNVTGYDLVKLMCGSHGTLGVLTELSFKLLPKPETTAVMSLKGLEDSEAVAVLSAALTSPYDVSGAAHLPATAPEDSETLVRIEGFEKSVNYRMVRLHDMLASFGPAHMETGDGPNERFEQLREVAPLAGRKGAIWRLSVKPSDGPVIVARLARQLDLRVIYDWGGGLVWLWTPEKADCGAVAIRAEISGAGGHATLMRASKAARETIDVFQPQSAAVNAIERGLRMQFDPGGILNPGRMRREQFGEAA